MDIGTAVTISTRALELAAEELRSLAAKIEVSRPVPEPPIPLEPTNDVPAMVDEAENLAVVRKAGAHVSRTLGLLRPRE